MWIYYVNSGTLTRENKQISGGYAGAQGFQNDSSFECKKNQGPLPRGKYTIGKPFHHPHAGGYAMRLTPQSQGVMCDRDGFMIHGDSIKHPGTASEGCIIFNHKIRKQIWESNDHELSVE